MRNGSIMILVELSVVHCHRVQYLMESTSVLF